MPVIFVPGNGGSKAQGRSIAAEAARQVARTHSAGLIFYLVHWRGELSALDTSILRGHAEYVQTCIQWVASETRMKSLFVVGHSMGVPLDPC